MVLMLFSKRNIIIFIFLLLLVITIVKILQPMKTPSNSASPYENEITKNAEYMLAEGKQTFRYETFGDEEFWGDNLRLHEAIEGKEFGGVGPGVSPKAALAAGLKIDSEALPPKLQKQILKGQVNLEDPAVTLDLLKLNSVVGLTGFFNRKGQLVSVGIQCALCHSIVDNSLAPGIGRRLDGWANRDLNVGAIINLAPNLRPFAELLGVDEQAVRRVLLGWGPGKFDAELILDGKGFRPDGKTAATLIPPAFGLAGINLHTWTGFGSIPYWNSFVAVLEMHGKGSFLDVRLNDPVQFPIAARAGLWNVRIKPDLVSPKLPALHFYQLALTAPKPPEGSFNKVAAEQGRMLFNGKARCATCHIPPTFSEPGFNMHKPEEIGIDSFQADRSPQKRYRTSPLKGLWTHQKGGFYHDGRFANLMQVVNHYNDFLKLNLNQSEKSYLVEYLKSL